jgi:hypothetical protein
VIQFAEKTWNLKVLLHSQRRTVRAVMNASQLDLDPARLAAISPVVLRDLKGGRRLASGAVDRDRSS